MSSRRTLVAVYVVAFLAMGLVASVPFALAQGASQHCPGESAQGAPALPPGHEIFAEGGSSGSIIQGDATISWEGTVITITGGSVTFCVKSATEATGIVTRGPGTYSTADFGLTNNQGQAQGVSHLVVYTVTTTTTTPPPTTTTTTPPPTTTTPPPTTTTPPPTTTTPPPTTTTPPGTTTTPPGTTPPLGGGGGTSPPSVLGGGGTNTGSPSPLAFTGSDGVLWLIGAGLLLLLLGTLALRLGSKPAPVRPTDRSA